MNPYHDPDKSHHRPHGFQNNYLEFEPKSLSELLRWRREAARQRLPPPPLAPTPRVVPELAWLRANAAAGAAMAPAVTWIGHATAMVQLGGLTVLTDPMFSARASPLPLVGPRRHAAPGLALAELPRVDLVLVSHNHYDHLDDASVRALNGQAGGAPLFIVPLGLKAWMAERDITHVVELDWWQSHTVGGVEVTLVPARHWSMRAPWNRNDGLWGGFVYRSAEGVAYHSGDTALFDGFTEIGTRLGPIDWAMLPIGAYEPRWFMEPQHMNPEDAGEAFVRLGARTLCAMHWGTFKLTDEPLAEPPRRIRKYFADHALDEKRLWIFDVGETRPL
jgi:N-acyl-phosphatidylethanolamine-hydrolysing phospholipase D